MTPVEVAALQSRLAGERRRTAAQLQGLAEDFEAIVESSVLTGNDDEHDPEGATVGFERAQVTAVLEPDTLFAHLHLGRRRMAGGVSVFLCGGGDKPTCPNAGTVTDVIDPRVLVHMVRSTPGTTATPTYCAADRRGGGPVVV